MTSNHGRHRRTRHARAVERQAQAEAAEIRVLMLDAAIEEVGPVEAARFWWGERGARLAASWQELDGDI